VGGLVFLGLLAMIIFMIIGLAGIFILGLLSNDSNIVYNIF
jgi:uncharacterized membrane protein YuzA (DUF378 family)